MNGGLPMMAGQQMDVNYLYQKVVELSEVLRENRERTQGIVAGAEELAVWQLGTRSHVETDECDRQTRAAVNGAAPSLQDANAEVTGTFRAIPTL